MARYFLHLRDSGGELLDPDGHDYSSLAALERAVLEAARELIAADALTGQIHLGWRIDAENAAGNVVHSLPFSKAVTISGA